MIHCYPSDAKNMDFWFQKGLKLIEDKKINTLYQTYFYEFAANAFKATNNLANLGIAQNRLIEINEDISLSKNDYIQNISAQYLENENKLFNQKLDLIKSQRAQQIYLFSSLGLILFSLSIWLFFKQKQNIKNKEIITLQQQKDITKLQALIEGEEKERIRLAQDLHDGINGDLSSIKFQLSSVDINNLSPENKVLFHNALNMIDSSCSQVRNISHNLSPTAITEFGLLNSVKNYCSKLEQLHPIKITFQHFGNEIKLSNNIETIIYRIVQELVNNIIKHAEATEAMVQINYHKSNMFITVEDNGKGFSKASKNAGIGLKNISSRIAFLNATLDEEHHTKGTTFNINIDLNNIPKS